VHSVGFLCITCDIFIKYNFVHYVDLIAIFKDFYIFQRILTGFETHPDSCSLGTGDLPVEVKGDGV
jgi:hypothetical protein